MIKKTINLILLVILFSPSVFGQMKIGHVNSQLLLDTMPSRKKAMMDLQKFEADGMQELKDLQADLEKSYKRYEQNQKSWTPVILEIEQKKIMEKEQRFKSRQSSLQNEMQVYGEALNAPILALIKQAIESVAQKNKLNYVIDETVTLYHSGGIDITKQVLAELLLLDKANK